MHDTLLRLFTLEGRVWFVQVVPFHESAAPLLQVVQNMALSPTAIQKLTEVHDTLLRPPTPEGRVWFVQVEPFHESATT